MPSWLYISNLNVLSLAKKAYIVRAHIGCASLNAIERTHCHSHRATKIWNYCSSFKVGHNIIIIFCFQFFWLDHYDRCDYVMWYCSHRTTPHLVAPYRGHCIPTKLRIRFKRGFGSLRSSKHCAKISHHELRIGLDGAIFCVCLCAYTMHLVGTRSLFDNRVIKWSVGANRILKNLKIKLSVIYSTHVCGPRGIHFTARYHGLRQYWWSRRLRLQVCKNGDPPFIPSKRP